MLAADTATQIVAVAVAWQVFAIAHRPLDLGLVGLILFLPTLLLAPVTGLLADRIDRRRIVVVASLAEIAGCVALTALAGAHGNVARAGDLGVIVVVGIARAFAWPAESSLLATIVVPERFVRAQATASAIRQLIVIGGPAAGGVLIGLAPLAAYGVAAALFVVGACALGTVRLVVAPPAGEAPVTFRAAFAGVRFIVRRPVLAGAMSLDLVAVFFGGATALLPVYAATILHVGASGFGALRSAVAIGAAASALWLARHPLRRGVGLRFLAAVALFGVATITFGLATTVWVAFPALIVVGAADMVSVVVRSGLVNLGTPDDMRGRVNAAEGVMIVASNELGEFESGIAATFFGPVVTVVAGGVLVLAAVLVWSQLFAPLRRLRSLEETA